MKKKLLAVLLTGVMAASFAGTATVVSADSCKRRCHNACQ